MISDKDIKLVEDVQELFLRNVFAVPKSVPKPAACWDTAMMMVKMRIIKNKLIFVKYLSLLNEESLATKVFTEQKLNRWPGLVAESVTYGRDFGLSPFDERQSLIQFKYEVKKKLSEANGDLLKAKIIKLKKLECMKMEEYGRKDYLSNLRLDEVRTLFRKRTMMLDFKDNFRNRKDYSDDLWVCDSCERAIESQSHVLWCPAYQELRENKDLSSNKDLAEYMGKVLRIRNELKLRR